MNNKMKWAQEEDGLTVTKNETVFWQSETRKETQLPIKYFTRGTKTTKIELMNTANIIFFFPILLCIFTFIVVAKKAFFFPSFKILYNSCGCQVFLF